MIFYSPPFIIIWRSYLVWYRSRAKTVTVCSLSPLLVGGAGRPGRRPARTSGRTFRSGPGLDWRGLPDRTWRLVRSGSGRTRPASGRSLYDSNLIWKLWLFPTNNYLVWSMAPASRAAKLSGTWNLVPQMQFLSSKNLKCNFWRQKKLLEHLKWNEKCFLPNYC